VATSSTGAVNSRKIKTTVKNAKEHLFCDNRLFTAINHNFLPLLPKIHPLSTESGHLSTWRNPQTLNKSIPRLSTEVLFDKFLISEIWWKALFQHQDKPLFHRTRVLIHR
jgi:hypothetical protein